MKRPEDVRLSREEGEALLVRLNGAGLRWGEAGADAVCRLRALFLSEPGPWEAFWNRN